MHGCYFLLRTPGINDCWSEACPLYPMTGLAQTTAPPQTEPAGRSGVEIADQSESSPTSDQNGAPAAAEKKEWRACVRSMVRRDRRPRACRRSRPITRAPSARATRRGCGRLDRARHHCAGACGELSRGWSHGSAHACELSATSICLSLRHRFS